MDKGAHFYKCDFQVHSPRDINWTGTKFGYTSDQIEGLTEEAIEELNNNRRQFAKEYLDKARAAGLNAIAITDHHDVVFAKIIRQVATAENASFVQQGQPEKCITVFPGIELSLVSPNCQCLLIFDADFPDTHLDSALGILGLIASHQYDKNTAPTVKIPMAHINDLGHLQKKLDEVPYFVGRYIVLPNLNFGGQFTLLRQGAHDHYKKMPCVGGYVDKAMPTDTGWVNKLNGGDVNYGNKAVGVISTSDNRFEDGREFGSHFSWIKWSEPSAEAFRQACLAKESRLSQDNPQLPQISVTKIDVTNSKFLGSFSIEFNQQYNCLIGGRGTGKSTILEYLRWALCDQTIRTGEVEELNEIERRRKSLIDKTLTQFEGEVRITFSLNGVNHIVKRSSVTNDIFLKIDAAEFQKATEDEIRRILPIQAYSQKQLSSVGVTGDELKRFIQSPILNEIGNLNFQLDDNVKRTKNSYQNLLRKKTIEKEINQFSLEVSSITNQVESLRKSLTGISPEDQVLISRKPILEAEATFVSSIQRELNSIKTKIDEVDLAFQKFPEEFPKTIQFENTEILNNLDGARKTKVNEIKTLVTQLKDLLKPENTTEIRGFISQWTQLKTAFDELYEAAKSKTTSNQQQLDAIKKIEDRLAQLQISIADRTAILGELGDPSLEFDSLRIEYWEKLKQKAALLDREAQKFGALSKGQIKIEILKNIDKKIIKDALTTAISGTRIQGDRIQAVCDDILQSENPLSQWDLILSELRLLAELDIQADANQALPTVQILSDIGFNAGNIKRIAEVLTPEGWLVLATLPLEFSPEFSYMTNNEMGDVIPFIEASAGQQATALLTVLLNQPGAPLIIDQPEDDIDNRAIDEVIKNIWDAKKHRQLIFTSHNANLVVNGDSELVVCCDYRESGNQTRGTIKAEGAIDSKAVRNEITSVMEGGEKAFRLRKDKYGF
ncbi:MAG: AAA family ATPase [Sphingobacteriales bacterium]|nr:AAA family ATPase [Sphingobacteriales bacterium]